MQDAIWISEPDSVSSDEDALKTGLQTAHTSAQKIAVGSFVYRFLKVFIHHAAKGSPDLLLPQAMVGWYWPLVIPHSLKQDRIQTDHMLSTWVDN